MDIKTLMASAVISAVMTTVTVPVVVNYVILQAGSPGTPQAGHINVTGNALAGRVGVNTSPTLARLQVNETGGLQGVRSISSTGVAVYGQSNATSGLGAGGYFTSASSGGRALVAEQFGNSGASVGGLFMNNSTNGVGVSGRAKAGSGATVGVYGETVSSSGMAGKFKNTANSSEAVLGGNAAGAFSGSGWLAWLCAGNAAGVFTGQSRTAYLVTNTAAGDFVSIDGPDWRRLTVATDASCAEFVSSENTIVGSLGNSQTGLSIEFGGMGQTGASLSGLDPTNIGISAANQATGNSMFAAGPNDSLQTAGALPRHKYNGQAKAMVPIAYGYVDSAGNVISGSGNFSVARTSAGHYDVDVSGVSGNANSFVLVANALAFDGLQWASLTAPVSTGDVGVAVGDFASGQSQDSDFTFVIYRAAGLAAPQMPANVAHPPQIKAFGGIEEWERADPRGYKDWVKAFNNYELAHFTKTSLKAGPKK